MEFYSRKQPDHYQLIRGVFYLIFGSAMIGVILLFTLSIDRKATVTAGEIISQNAPIQYLAPMEAIVSQILIKEGDQVMAGDKLIVLKNAKLDESLAKTKRELMATRDNIIFHERQIQNLSAKINRQKSQLSFLTKKYNNEKQSTLNDLENLDEQYVNHEERIKISQKRIDNLRQLFTDGAISGNEYDKMYKSYLDEQNRMLNYRNQAYQKTNNFDRLNIETAQKENELQLTLLKAEADYLKKEKNVVDAKRKVTELEAEIEIIKLSLESLVLKATVDGYITDMFTTKLKTTFITNSQTLCILNPLVEEEFFAKVTLKEEELKDVIPGQKVHMKLSAFNHFQFGVLKGEVIRINKEVIKEKQDIANPSDAVSTFYALVGIPESEAMKYNIKSGFKVTGDIILDRVKLYKFIIESMLKN